ncbi:MAG TPA: Mur ligase domain-containing protein, partial [Bacillota bacterium]|nr:Mur ligase domain-containing protein [Bacillota bacterium]
MMEALSMGEIARAANGVLMNFEEESEVSGVSTDSRKINPGDMFIALAGENFDGHDFIDKAIEKGAVLAVTQRLPERCKIPYILVEDTLKALQDIAAYYRSKFNI